MPNPFFRFKQFTIWHDKCAMKVGTDGTLLGAWVNVNTCQTILDIGTGTGLIALMLAQRNKKAIIDGIEIDPDACLQASENVIASPFAEQIHIHNGSFQSFAKETKQKYDLIVSNPPYFTESLKCPEKKRKIARHNDELPFSDLVKQTSSLLAPNGRIALILPFLQKKYILDLAELHQLHCIRQTIVYAAENSPPKRLLIEFSNQLPFYCKITNLILEDQQRQRSKAYQELTQEFYL